MSGGAVLVIAVLTVVCAVVTVVTRRLHLGGGALVGVGAGTGTLLFLTGELGLGIAALACTWGVAASAQVVGQVVARAEQHRGARRRRAPWLVALLSTAILVASLGLGVGAVDWVEAPERTAAGGGEAAPGAIALAVLGVAAALALARFAPRAEDR
jgi:hypothetical protein